MERVAYENSNAMTVIPCHKTTANGRQICGGSVAALEFTEKQRDMHVFAMPFTEHIGGLYGQQVAFLHS
jgi:hypothetical protein